MTWGNGEGILWLEFKGWLNLQTLELPKKTAHTTKYHSTLARFEATNGSSVAKSSLSSTVYQINFIAQRWGQSEDSILHNCKCGSELGVIHSTLCPYYWLHIWEHYDHWLYTSMSCFNYRTHINLPATIECIGPENGTNTIQPERHGTTTSTANVRV